MSPVAFLLSALGICTVGVLLLLLRNRQPSGTTHGVRSFEREMRALDPKRNKARHDPFGRPEDGVIDLRDERPSTGVSIVVPARSTPSVVVVAVPKPDATAATDTTNTTNTTDVTDVTHANDASGASIDSNTTAAADAPPTDPGEADRPRDEARG